MTFFARKPFIACAAAAYAAVISSVTPTAAQSLPEPLPVQPQIDSFGVDLIDRTILLGGLAGVSIGTPNAGGLSFSWTVSDTGWRHSGFASLSSAGSTYFVSIGDSAVSFTKSGSVFTPDLADGSSLSDQSTYYMYIDRMGVEYKFDKSLVGYVDASVNEGVLTRITYPDNYKINFNYNSVTLSATAKSARLQSISNNLNFRIHLDYATNTAASAADFPEWNRITKATGYNNNVDFCGIFANSCSFTQTWPHVSYTGTQNQIATAKNALNQTTAFYYNTSDKLRRITLPGAGWDEIIYSYTDGMVTSVNAKGVVWTYAATDDAGLRTLIKSGPLSVQETIISDLSIDRIISVEDNESQKTQFAYDANNRLERITAPRGNYTEYEYDARGNLEKTRYVDSSGTLPGIVFEAVFPASCANAVTCNKPTSTIDANLKTTLYTYDAVHGGVTSVKYPQYLNKRQRIDTSYDDNHNGGPLLWRPVTVKTCATAETCAGTANESVVEIEYSGVHVQPRSTTQKNGTGALSATTLITYDDDGNVETVNGPLSGADDKAFYFYDEMRRSIGVIGPDPDGAGGRDRAAQLTDYLSWGGVDKTYFGETTGTTRSALLSMTKLQTTDINYSNVGRPNEAIFLSGATTTAVSHTSYDSVGRVKCEAYRMVLAGYQSAGCTPSTPGAFGQDRITHYTYDNASRVTEIRTAYGVDSEVRVSAKYTYIKNNLVKTVEDGEGNVTTYGYDGYGRRIRTTYPGGDDDFLTLDAMSRVTTHELRDGQEIDYVYNNLGAVITVDAPGTADDIAHVYDVMGRRTSVTANGQTETFVWDMLGRLTSASGALGTVAYQYDIAGRRTRLTWPDSFYVSYDHDLDGALTAICEQVSVCSPSSTALLAGFAYNNRGQRTALDYGNGLSVAYAYDASDRLSSLAHDLTGASDDQSFTFDYNPAGQIVSRAKTNTAYDYDALSNVTIDSVANALNQITCIGDTAPACTGGTSTTHDARGNMTAIGADTYSYDIYNRMTAGGSATLSYDGAGRLYEADDGVDARRFLYDGAHVIAEYDDTGTMLHRYVRGASGDEVLVEYDGSGTSSFDKTWLHHDERGSVIAGSNFLGAKQFINTYDEFGKPDAANEGSFQYTGQLYLPETETAGAGTGLYHYKARAYHPELGRFMQTDPVGYADGLNLYAYVSGDPVNRRDPSGLLEESDAIDHDIPINPNDRRYDGDEIVVEQERRIRLDVGRSMQFAFEQGLRDLFASNTITFNFGEAADGDTGDGGGDDSCGTTTGNAAPNSTVLNTAAGELGAFGQGVGDAFTFGLYSKILARLPGGYGELYSGQTQLNGYNAGLYGSAGAGGLRLAYSGLAYSVRFTGVSGPQAVSFRNNLKSGFALSFLYGGHPRAYSYNRLLTKYGSEAAVVQAASRTNPAINTAGGLAAAGGATTAAQGQGTSNCSAE